MGLRLPVVIVEDEDGSDAARAHHEHDAAEKHAWKQKTFTDGDNRIVFSVFDSYYFVLKAFISYKA